MKVSLVAISRGRNLLLNTMCCGHYPFVGDKTSAAKICGAVYVNVQSNLERILVWFGNITSDDPFTN